MYAQKLAEYEVKYLKAIEEGEIKEKKEPPKKKKAAKTKTESPKIKQAIA